MTIDQVPPSADLWADWLLQHRFGDDPAYADAARGRLAMQVDRLLDGAHLIAGMTLADIGAGDGLVAFRAIERVGAALATIFTDVSVPLLRHAEGLASERGVRDQCAFHPCAADDLRPLATGSVDVVTTRAVLAYVADKAAAFGEFHRVLRPGGRISLAEPVFRDEALEVSPLKRLVDARPNRPPGDAVVLLHRWLATQFPDTPEGIASSPLTNYGERDLVRFALGAGFTEIHLEFHIDVLPLAATSWAGFLGKSPHPWAKPLGIVLEEQFSPAERRILETSVHAAMTAPNAVTIERMAYLTATKP